MRNHWLRITGGIIGIVIIFLMLFANQIGLESFPTWGIRRLALLTAGLILLFAAVFYRNNNFIGKIFGAKDGRFFLSIIFLDIAIILIYLWFASDGLWKSLPNETNYYDLLATAFSHGHIALEVDPDPALLALKGENLYEPENRQGMDVLWDATLYDGKYYIYWGPAPALVLAIIKPFYAPDLGDKLIGLIFLSGTLIFLTLLILDLWRNYFSRVPRWAFLAAIAFAGLVNPMPYIMVEGRIYEAAIIAAQFFLVGGFYFLQKAFHRPNGISLAFASLFFTLAVGSRTTLVPAIGFVALIVLIWAFQTQRDKMIPLIAAFAIPLALGTVSYGWYNFARFGSVTEFGLRYQLTSYNLYKSIGETFSMNYIPPNLYKTLLNPLERRDAFPYIFPTRWAGPSWLTDHQSDFYLTYSEYTTGIFISSPFILLALLLIYRPRRDLRWFILSVAAVFVISFIIMQAFFFVAMRYMLDAIPTLALIAIMGFWHGFDVFRNSKVYIVIAMLLFIYTFALSLLIAFSGNMELFKIHNLEMIKQMTWTFNHLFK